MDAAVTAVVDAFATEAPKTIEISLQRLAEVEPVDAATAVAKLITVLCDLHSLGSWAPSPTMKDAPARAVMTVIEYLVKDLDAEQLAPLRRLFGVPGE